MTNGAQQPLTRQTGGELARSIQLAIKPWLKPLALVFAIGSILFAWFELPYADALPWILFGCLLPLFFWSRLREPSLPLAVLVGAQTLIIFATPLVTSNRSIADYAPAAVYDAGVEIFLFCAALTLAWRVAYATTLRLPAPTTYFGLGFIRIENPDTLCRAALLLMGVGAA